MSRTSRKNNRQKFNNSRKNNKLRRGGSGEEELKEQVQGQGEGGLSTDPQTKATINEVPPGNGNTKEQPQKQNLAPGSGTENAPGNEQPTLAPELPKANNGSETKKLLDELEQIENQLKEELQKGESENISKLLSDTQELKEKTNNISGNGNNSELEDIKGKFSELQGKIEALKINDPEEGKEEDPVEQPSEASPEGATELKGDPVEQPSQASPEAANSSKQTDIELPHNAVIQTVDLNDDTVDKFLEKNGDKNTIAIIIKEEGGNTIGHTKNVKDKDNIKEEITSFITEIKQCLKGNFSVQLAAFDDNNKKPVEKSSNNPNSQSGGLRNKKNKKSRRNQKNKRTKKRGGAKKQQKKSIKRNRKKSKRSVKKNNR